MFALDMMQRFSINYRSITCLSLIEVESRNWSLADNMFAFDGIWHKDNLLVEKNNV